MRLYKYLILATLFLSLGCAKSNYEISNILSQNSCRIKTSDSQCSGTLIPFHDHTYILTVAHGIDDVKDNKVNVYLDRQDSKGKIYHIIYPATIVATSKSEDDVDLAVLLVKDKILCRQVKLSDQSNLYPVGTNIYAVGCYFGEVYPNSYATGIITSSNRVVPWEQAQNYVQSNMPVEPGYSGTGVYDKDLRLIGVISKKHDQVSFFKNHLTIKKWLELNKLAFLVD